MFYFILLPMLLLSYLSLSFRGLITLIQEERADFFFFYCNHLPVNFQFVVFVYRGFVFLLQPRIGLSFEPCHEKTSF